MSFPCISSVLCFEKASNVSNEFSKPSFCNITLVCFNQISSTQTCISCSSIHAFFCVLMMNSSGTRNFRIAFSVVPLKIILGGNILPSAVADKPVVTCLISQPEVRTTHSFEQVLQILLVGILSKKTQEFHPYFLSMNAGITNTHVTTNLLVEFDEASFKLP